VSRNPEYLRLPRGFEDRAGAEAERDMLVIEKVAKRGRAFGCEFLHTTPLGQLATFGRGRALPLDKIYAFQDKAGRDVSLVSDSTPMVMRWMLDAARPVNRVCFLSPIFRYRRQNTRYFHQIGYAIAGERSARDAAYDETSALLAREAIQLFQDDFDIGVSLHVTDFGAWHRTLAAEAWTPDRVREAMHELRPLGPAERRAFLSALQIRPTALADLLTLADPGTVGPELERLTAPAAAFASAATRGLATRYELRPGDLHSSELQCGIAFSIVDQTGQRCGDGGCYADYGARFDERIVELKSFATGVEWIGRHWRGSRPPRPLVVFLGLDVSAESAEPLVDACRQAGLDTIWRQSTGKLTRDFSALPDRWTRVVLFGSRERESDEVRVVTKPNVSQQVAKRDLLDLLLSADGGGDGACT
jgi:hypothetical protein